MMSAQFKSAREVSRQAAEILRPPQTVRPSDAAAAVLRTEKGPWIPELVPYLSEPLDALGGREYQGIVFVGPARTGKTMGLILGGIAYVVTAAPGDMLVIQMSQDAARDFSRLDLDRALRHSPALSERMSPRARDDNTFDKFFRSGVALKLGWPAVSQLSSKTLQYVFLTDYDRPENVDNVDGEGPMWGLARKRTQTFMSRGKTVAESSPGRDYVDSAYVRRGNEAPPARGILELYNGGTRARWHWPCQHCGQHFEAAPGLECFALPEWDDLVEEVKRRDLMTLAEQFARVICPHCGASHEPREKAAMNTPRVDGGRILGATWLHDGETIVEGKIEGERRRSTVWSGWLGGVAAAYQTWPSIIHEYLMAVLAYARTGDEGPLRRTTNTDQGAPYIPRSAAGRRTADDLMRRREQWQRGMAPEGVRFITASVDVQPHEFRANFYGWGVGLESWLLDRTRITASKRREGDRFAGVEPAAYVEDWDLLLDVMAREFAVEGTDAKLRPLLTFCDSGGREGVTVNAYEFWRRLRLKGLHRRFRLVKGVGNLNAPRLVESFPDARGKTRGAGRGDVPVYLLNVNLIKDGIFGDLSRQIPGPGFVHLPEWIEDEYFAEITAEQRTAKGWVRENSHQANEDFDLHAYARAACIPLKAELINWERPPSWATPPASRPKGAPAEGSDEMPEPRKPPQSRRPVTPTRWSVTDW